jgi:hypothetical protein
VAGPVLNVLPGEINAVTGEQFLDHSCTVTGHHNDPTDAGGTDRIGHVLHERDAENAVRDLRK